jgi:hypothetical protein
MKMRMKDALRLGREAEPGTKVLREDLNATFVRKDGSPILTRRSFLKTTGGLVVAPGLAIHLAGCEEAIVIVILAISLAKKIFDLVEDVRGGFQVQNDNSDSFNGEIRLALVQDADDTVVDTKRAALTIDGKSKRSIDFDSLYGERGGNHRLLLTIRDKDDNEVVKKQSERFQIVD